MSENAERRRRESLVGEIEIETKELVKSKFCLP